MIGQMSSAALLVTSIVMATIAIVLAVGIYSIGKKMVSVPNENIIQINLDVRFIPLSVNGVLLFIFASTSFYGFQKYQEQLFMETEGVEETGWMGGGHLKERGCSKLCVTRSTLTRFACWLLIFSRDKLAQKSAA